MESSLEPALFSSQDTTLPPDHRASTELSVTLRQSRGEGNGRTCADSGGAKTHGGRHHHRGVRRLIFRVYFRPRVAPRFSACTGSRGVVINNTHRFLSRPRKKISD
ncbi:hypothetical protein AVEN_67333-1 [Araneus ventricosus]|uniref:Uncharacterized protein n=1 Tax=Araneus ventricosus TaxID=182803 RepID=A0A4Y2HRP9_ARAVE|nr:hypothetical protein AVEN_67333-1 [Araneus ventricosus]